MGKKKNAAKGAAGSSRDKGFDFGASIAYVSFPDVEWVEELSSAHVVGCAYGLESVAELRSRVPSLSLVVRNAEPIRQVFKKFETWVSGSDDDAVEINIIFLKAGGYLLGISREYSRAVAQKPVPAFFDRFHYFESWIKKMDTTHPSVHDLQRYHREIIAPIAVGFVQMPALLLVPDASVAMRRIDGTRSLIKFKLGFFDEDDSEAPPSARAMLEGYGARRNRKSLKQEVPKRSADNWNSKRAKVLRELFPVTLLRAERTGLIGAVRTKLGKARVADWQIQQAVCNLVASTKIGSKHHYSDLASTKLVEKLADFASSYGEVANGDESVALLRVDDVVRQLWLDADYLVKAIGGRPKDGSFASRQSVLVRRGYLAD